MFGRLFSHRRDIPATDRYRIGRLSVQPGDVLVAKFDCHLSARNAARIRDHIAGLAPPGVKTLVLDQQCELSVLTAEETDARAEEAA